MAAMKTAIVSLEDLEGRATVNVETAAAVLGISRDLAYRLAANGALPGLLKLGGRYVVSVPQLRRVIEGESA